MADLKKEIQARQNELNEKISAKSDEAFNYYTDDCVMMASAHEIIHGKEGLKKMSAAMAALQSQVGKTEGTIEEVFGNGPDIVTARGKGTTYTKDGSVLLQTKAVGVWKKVNGKWLLHNYIWNTDKPMSM